MEATVLSSTQTTDQWGYDVYQYKLDGVNLLSTGLNEAYSWKPDGNEAIVLSGTQIHLEEGEKYLMLLEPSEGGPFIDPTRVARINENRTIDTLSHMEDFMEYVSVFEGYNGAYVDRMIAEAEGAKAWRERFVMR